MKIPKRNIPLYRRQVEEKLKPWGTIVDKSPPPMGWIRAIRESLGMSLRQFGRITGMAQKTLFMFEKGEVKGTISLKSLKKIASNLGCDFVYAVVPRESLDEILDRQARNVARKLLSRTSHSMALENQKIRPGEEEAQITELASELKSSMKKILWDET
ncbi:MAG TPA: mobile mystery protein A [Bdellovibrionota bacterium]|nr:mobile mystery protein A [Bdellovibrionota bacterium]